VGFEGGEFVVRRLLGIPKRLFLKLYMGFEFIDFLFEFDDFDIEAFDFTYLS
jgi:hypothetical protein